MLLSLLNIRGILAVSADQFVGKLVALIEAFCADFNTVLEVIEFVLKDLKG